MDKVTRQGPQTTTFFEEKGEPRRYRTEVLPLTNLTLTAGPNRVTPLSLSPPLRQTYPPSHVHSVSVPHSPGVIKKAGASSPRARLTRDPIGGLAALLPGMSLPCGAPGCMRMSDITLMPCGHKTLCRNCCLNTSECPLCDTIIERRIHKRSGVYRI